MIIKHNTLNEIDPRLQARLMDRRLVRIAPITAPSYRGKETRKRPKR